MPVILLTASIMAFGIYLPFSSVGAHLGMVPLPLSYFPWLAGILLRADATCETSLYSPLWSMAVMACFTAEIGQTSVSALGSMLRTGLFALLPSYFG
jgi:hypothetical protein